VLTAGGLPAGVASQQAKKSLAKVVKLQTIYIIPCFSSLQLHVSAAGGLPAGAAPQQADR
jgi:hypothetical protein